MFCSIFFILRAIMIKVFELILSLIKVLLSNVVSLRKSPLLIIAYIHLWKDFSLVRSRLAQPLTTSAACVSKNLPGLDRHPTSYPIPPTFIQLSENTDAASKKNFSRRKNPATSSDRVKFFFCIWKSLVHHWRMSDAAKTGPPIT